MSEQTQDQTTVLQDIVISDSVAVVTGGASGIGKGIVGALLRHGAKVVIADIEQSAIDETVAEMSAHGDVAGLRTDITDEASVKALADAVYERHGKVNLLYNNAGVTSGGGGKPWQQEPNDWRWCFGVNVFGTAICTSEFVPRMIEGGHPGQVINTSSGDGGFAPVPTASVYAASKAAVSCFTEALHHNLESEGTQLRASVFYPAGGLQRTGLFTAQRNRPEHLQRVGEGTGRKSMTFDEMKALLERSGRDVKEADLDAQGDMVVNNTVARTYIITNDLRDTVDLLHRRADAIGRLEVPPHHGMPKMT
ncbi:MAG: SDR family NAD(P)-dependent oxidoreductase [Actinomycetota bacterium]|nr:short-chain dehydrogenase [Acidimicrobiaceae bacterium]MEC7672374.1 SDR family NAD(P)-dependent oxidoreductase [Actinomycetota bacterium]MEC8687136.1 SDR family NAD(P)-dependent oxidoreductase [Actinomycetota bacterium]HCH81312.1 short-chain dehydrogenase [Acidimicrobiaceae bacterium]